MPKKAPHDADKEALKPVSVYMPIPLAKDIEDLADRERRSISAQIVLILEQALHNRAK